MPETAEKPARSGCWPSGMTFLLYCAGVALLLLVLYVIGRGEGFKFGANEKGVTLETVTTPLNQGGVPTDPATQAQTGKQLEQRFENVTEASPQNVAGPFNGRWNGNGSFYQLEQRGPDVALLELTNGIVTSFAKGTANGTRASLVATNVTGLTFPVEIELLEDGRLKLMAGGMTVFLDPA